MTTELTWLTLTALLASAMFIPYVVGVNRSEFDGKDVQFVRPPDPRTMPAWVHRSFRAHQNLLEQLVPYAIIVLVGAVAHVSTPITRACVPTFFGIRVVHAIGMISGRARLPIRPAIFSLGWVVVLVHTWQVLAS